VRNTRQGTVAVTCRRTSQGWRIAVRDSGPGIAPEHHARIFDEFQQLNNPLRDGQHGLGLGLSTARRMARLLDAPIGLRSCPGHGSTFWVEVASGEPALAAAQDTPMPVDPLTGRRLLVVDDDAAVRAGMRSLLEAWGAEVVTAADSTEALATLGGSAPDLLISDWSLVTETGPQAIAALRQRFPGQPALLMTADSATERRTQAGELGVDLLIKPVQPARLRAALNSLLCAQPSAPIG
jgi:CheY-like chemotaxis protein